MVLRRWDVITRKLISNGQDGWNGHTVEEPSYYGYSVVEGLVLPQGSWRKVQTRTQWTLGMLNVDPEGVPRNQGTHYEPSGRPNQGNPRQELEEANLNYLDLAHSPFQRV